MIIPRRNPRRKSRRNWNKDILTIGGGHVGAGGGHVGGGSMMRTDRNAMAQMKVHDD